MGYRHETHRTTPGEDTSGTPQRFKAISTKDLARMPELDGLSPSERLEMRAVAAVLPFRTNRYVVDHLIDWSDVPNDPIFQLTFPQPGMLDPEDLEVVAGLVRSEAPPREIQKAARAIQQELNPHPAGQLELNVPRLHGAMMPGMQHKYRETVLFFPSAGQTCHAYCTYCFRWAQFVGLEELQFAARHTDHLVRYLKAHREVTNVLITGGDPLIMKTSVLRRYIEPLLDPSLEHLQSIRLGTKALSYWPQRFVTDSDADDLLTLFEDVQRSGRHIALMAHYSHARELATPMAQKAVERVLSAGATVRCQAPLIRHVNDSADDWADLWNRQVRLGAVPYYMFVERDTGAQRYFEVPLGRALDIFNLAYRQVSGLARTVRGPSMSATPGKVLVDGVATIHGERVFVLKFLQARDPAWVGRPFFAKFDPTATWLDDLEPAFGQGQFFFTKELEAVKRARHQPRVGPRRDLPVH